jgi:pyruvate kinase
MHRNRKAKIVATIGPASNTRETIEALFHAGVDVFRMNFSHGTHEDHKRRLDVIREVEAEVGRPIGILLDLQGPKLRIGTFSAGPVVLESGARFRLDLDDKKPGDQCRVSLPHPEVFAALVEDVDLLLDDGKIHLKVERCGSDFADTRVINGGMLSERKGVNVPGVVLPMSAMTAKDRRDLEYGLSLGIDWVALSFVQRPEDIEEVKDVVKGRAAVMPKLEKPAAINQLEQIVEVCDAIMVARGDLGVEMPAEQVPAIQKRIVRMCRRFGKPVVVATQMLESMINAPVPTRAEASDVATAVYDGADAVMLSAESASGRFPVEAVRMMSRIIDQTEADPFFIETMQGSQTPARPEIADAIGLAMRNVVELLDAAATVAYTSTGYSALRVARERPKASIIGMTPKLSTARKLALVWGVHPVLTHDVATVSEMTVFACQTATREQLAKQGETIVIAAGMPFGTPGTTSLLRIAQIE